MEDEVWGIKKEKNNNLGQALPLDLEGVNKAKKMFEAFLEFCQFH